MNPAIKKLVGLLVISLMALPGCGEGGSDLTGQNDLEVHWVVSGGRCVDAGIFNVDIELLNADGELLEQNRFLCANGHALFNDVPVGIYTVYFKGLDAANNLIYSAETELVRVEENQDDEGPTRLLPPAELEVIRAVFEINWVFETGHICSFEGVQTIDVAIWDQIIAQKVVGQRVDCDFDPTSQDLLSDDRKPKGLVIGELVPRPSRIELFGLDEAGTRIFSGSAGPFELTPGEIRTAEITLSSCEGELGTSCR